MTRDDALAQALAHHRAGQIGDAAQLYDAILAVVPQDGEVLHLAGVAAGAQGDPTHAVRLIRQALAVRETADTWSNLGIALGQLGRHAEAIDGYHRALAIQPAHAAALNNLGVSLDALQRFPEAVDAYQRAIAAAPGYAAALGNLGNTLLAMGRPDAARAAYERALIHEPGGSRAMLGKALRALGRGADAIAAFRHDVDLRPDDTQALNGLAAALSDQARFPLGEPADVAAAAQRRALWEEAVVTCDRALTLQPGDPESLRTLGVALSALDRLSESEVALRKALALRPAEVGGYNNLALTLQAQHRAVEALAVLDLATALDPNDAQIQHHRATILLRLGRFAEGWDAYEWRFQIKQTRDIHAQLADHTRWRGEPLAGRTILLMPEQGFGDAIQFVRYAGLVAARGGRVLLGVEPPLARLWAGLPGVTALAPLDQALPAFDLYCPLLSLPRVFKTDLASIPAAIPYLTADPDSVLRWTQRLRIGPSGLRVGVVWAGNPAHPADEKRSLPSAALAPLWDLPGINWFSLQAGLAEAASGAVATLENLAPDLTDFAETAAAIMGLDLVIAADTAVAHLAGALGKPVWVLLPYIADWRWLEAGATSPWYPTMRLFRQDAGRGWQQVIEAVVTALRDQAGAGGYSCGHLSKPAPL